MHAVSATAMNVRMGVGIPLMMLPAPAFCILSRQSLEQRAGRESIVDADNRLERFRGAREHLGPADHACTLYDERDEEVAIAASYIRAGLARGELCVCVV